jgi:hypothetical protein
LHFPQFLTGLASRGASSVEKSLGKMEIAAKAGSAPPIWAAAGRLRDQRDLFFERLDPFLEGVFR